MYGVSTSHSVDMLCIDPDGQKKKITVRGQNRKLPYYDEILVDVKDEYRIKCLASSLEDFRSQLMNTVLSEEERKKAPENCLKVETVRLQPVIGFRDLEKRLLLKIKFSNLFLKYKLKQLFSQGYGEPVLSQCSIGDYDLGRVELIHEKLSSELLFLIKSKLRLGTWIATDAAKTFSSGKKVDGTFQCLSVNLENVQTVENPPSVSRIPAIVPFVLAYVDITAVSAASTKFVQFLPSAQEKDDRIVGWTVLLRKEGSPDGEHQLLKSREGDSEQEMLLALQRAIEPAVVLCYFPGHFNPIEYLHHRLALAHRRSPGSVLSRGLRALDSGSKRILEGDRSIVYKGSLSLRITEGYQRMDLKNIMKGRQVKPNLSGFTPDCILNHPKIIKRGADGEILSGLQPLLSPCPSARLGSDNEPVLVQWRQAFVHFLLQLKNDISAVENHISISRECSLSLSEVCGAGSEKRITHLLFRCFLEKGYYVNEDDRLKMVQCPIYVRMVQKKTPQKQFFFYCWFIFFFFVLFFVFLLLTIHFLLFVPNIMTVQSFDTETKG